ncbi:hypothetical protein ACP3V3_16840 [Vibrio sp. PNB22_3_1]
MKYWLMLSLILLAFPVSADLVQSNAGASVAALWNTMWPNTWSMLSNLSKVVVLLPLYLFAAWVTMGLYSAYAFKGQITLQEAGVLFFRMLVVMSILTAVMDKT